MGANESACLERELASHPRGSRGMYETYRLKEMILYAQLFPPCV
jgi:hypothetical protein